MSVIVTMRQDEPLRLDSERLADMFLDLGEARAADLLSLSLVRLEGLLEALALAVGHGRAADCIDFAGQIAALGDALGLLSLGDAARGVVRAAASGDAVALAATQARLIRIARRSQRIAAELQHRSG
ncbi:hypothetical protein [Rhodovulum adriaticum]|uniref:Hpt domain-containing protein n=1 Tax=Rhodovulum adriaticum TaxID=35804 RepID=A0A4R2NHY3_RHOAD|nr:hypothetical protein [Rhodovulum adriaticum]MBK1637159.1 hypothetical protein [Rhodovulum adriaticum]TCP20940.1 hypothetical protein EV656_11561 [Rhodovulum adriaticum]